MILKAKETFGFMPHANVRKYGISPVAGKENEKVWPRGENSFKIVKGEEYNVAKSHPFFGDKVSGNKKVQHDDSPSPD